MSDEHQVPIWFPIDSSESDSNDEIEEYEDDRMDVYDADEMDLVSYFDYSDPAPLDFTTPNTDFHDNALHAFIESVNNGGAPISPRGLDGVLNGLVEGAGPEAVESLFVRFGPGELECGRCVLLRDIVHSNAVQTVRVYVHGSDSHFTHAIFHVENVNGEGTEVPTNDCYYLDLRPVDNGWVDGFLQFYLSFLPADGSITTADNISPLYHTLSCQPINRNPPFHIVPNLPQLPPPNGFSDIPESSSAQDRRSRGIIEPRRVVAKTGLAAQRERTHTMSLEELSNYFHLSIAQAAKELNLCSTAVKHICRRHGIARWPGRKVISVNKQLAKLERAMTTKQGEELENIREQIRTLNEYKQVIYTTGIPPY